jgi:preprotein translocase subunit SecE
MSLIQYLKDTRSELHHVAWPTRTQTIVFTALVISLSILVSLYLGLFDYLFTNALGSGLERLPKQESVIDLNQLQLSTTSAELVPIGEETPVEGQ